MSFFDVLLGLNIVSTYSVARYTLTSRIRKPYCLSRPVCETIFDSVFNIERLSSSPADDKPLSKEASL